MSEPARPLRDLRGLTRVVRALLIAQAVLALAAAAAALSYGPGFDAEAGSPLYLVVALLQVLVTIPAGVLLLRWIYLANRNVHTLGAEGVGGPVMAVAWYFIPVASLFMPYQSMREIWKASRQPRDWEIVEPPATIAWWWFFWVAGSLAGIVAWRLAAEGSPGDTARLGETLTTAADVLTIPASLLLAAIVAGVTGLQESQRGAIAASAGGSGWISGEPRTP